MIVLVKKAVTHIAATETLASDDPLSQPYHDHLRQLEQAALAHQNTFHRLQEILSTQQISHLSITLSENWNHEIAAKLKATSSRVLYISLGGDGTFLQVAAAIDSPETAAVLGLRSTAYSVGSLCSSSESDLETIVMHYKGGGFQVKYAPRVMAKITSLHDGSVSLTPPAFNDLLYTHSHPGSAVRYILSYGDVTEKHTSSGLWVYTHQGASAGAGAAGATEAISTDQFGFVVREPYGAFSWQNHWPKKIHRNVKLSSGSFACARSATQSLAMVNLSSGANLVLDGRACLPLKSGDKVEFLAGPDLALYQFC